MAGSRSGLRPSRRRDTSPGRGRRSPTWPWKAATAVLRTEWYVAGREDGGTDLHLLETGLFDEQGWAANSAGWDSDVLAALKRVLGETA